MRELTPDQYMQKARIKLLSKQPFFGTLAMHLNIREDGNAVPTLGTAMQTILYNPQFVSELAKRDFDLLIAAVAHELGHTYPPHTTRAERPGAVQHGRGLCDQRHSQAVRPAAGSWLAL